MTSNIIVSSNKQKFIHGPFNDNYSDDIVLNHYFCKTLDEYKEKISRGRADSPINLTLDNFDLHNFNETINTIAKDFFNNV